LTEQAKEKLTEKLRRDPGEFDGIKVAKVARTDGLKLVLADGSWVCYRLSGTEPVVRVYSEARSRESLARLSGAAKKWIFD
jgi:phosphomannomutase